jgi:hypothetical protein
LHGDVSSRAMELPADSCSLDIVDREPDGLPLDAVGKALGGLTRERVRQIEAAALVKLNSADAEAAARLKRSVDEARRRAQRRARKVRAAERAARWRQRRKQKLEQISG